MIAERKIGLHRVVLHSEDVAMGIFGGNPTEADMRAILAAYGELLGSKPFFVVIDLSKVDTLSPAVRRVIGESPFNFRAFGMCGASFQMKVVAKLINNALALLKKATVPQEYFKTHGEALAWFDELRRNGDA